MDRLDHLLPTAEPLLKRVDEVLGRAGAPAGHPVWAELRRVRLLPGDAARAVAALRPVALAEAGPELRSGALVCAELGRALPVADAWSGTAAEAYEQVRGRVAEQLRGDADSLGGRLAATADLGDALTDWMERTRERLATVLARLLGSAEAVALTAGDGRGLPTGEEAAAAADAAAALLQVVADSYDRAEDLLRDTADL